MSSTGQIRRTFARSLQCGAEDSTGQIDFGNEARSPISADCARPHFNSRCGNAIAGCPPPAIISSKPIHVRRCVRRAYGDVGPVSNRMALANPTPDAASSSRPQVPQG